jgi:hypothetical protein
MDVNELKFILQDSHIPYTDDEMTFFPTNDGFPDMEDMLW